jgi:hypothetical protein
VYTSPLLSDRMLLDERRKTQNEKNCAISCIRNLTLFIGLILLTQTVLANENSPKPHSIQQGVITTSIGIIEIEFYSKQAPLSVTNLFVTLRRARLIMDNFIGWCD